LGLIDSHADDRPAWRQAAAAAGARARRGGGTCTYSEDGHAHVYVLARQGVERRCVCRVVETESGLDVHLRAG
jgi:hypothetical protein